MAQEIPKNTPEREQPRADNARKFLVGNIDPAALADDGVTKSYRLTTDWLTTGENDESKLALKQFADGHSEYLQIAKVTVNGNRTTRKHPIDDPREYATLLEQCDPHYHVDKQRSEFTIRQDGQIFDAKYDQFYARNGTPIDDLRVLEIDAADGVQRDAFDPAAFPFELTEVSDDRSYEGYRIADKL